jgi:ADP-ribose pyrophosphatase YjhB (NUDIX family)
MSKRTEPTLVDRGFQLAYVCAYRAMRTYWRVRRPTTHGTIIALWNRGEVLLVRNSYVPYYSAPGGYIRAGETARDAVVRELREEVGIEADPASIEFELDRTHEWEGKHDHVQIFSLDLPERPEIAVDNREVIEASWWAPEAALRLDLFPPLRDVIEARKAPQSGTVTGSRRT